jgi:hypothetical protein
MLLAFSSFCGTYIDYFAGCWDETHARLPIDMEAVVCISYLEGRGQSFLHVNNKRYPNE